MAQKNSDVPLTATDAARYLQKRGIRIGGYGVAALGRRGRLACTRDSAGRRLYRTEDLERLIADRRTGAR
jgi:hypothetical protein